MTRALEINAAIDAQLLQVLEPVLVGRFLTRRQVDAYLRVAQGFLWPTDTIKVEKVDGFDDRQWKVTIVRTLWQGEYPLDDNASIIYYERDAQLRILMEPRQFLVTLGLTPESFRGAPFFSQQSLRMIRQRIRDREPLDPLFLDISHEPDPPRWKVVSHEGRHRALAVHDAGIEQVPVILFVRVEGDLEALWNLNETQIVALHEFAGKLRA